MQTCEPIFIGMRQNQNNIGLNQEFTSINLQPITFNHSTKYNENALY